VAGILMLVDEGKLTLDDTIIKHVPGLPSTDYWSFFQDMSLDEQITRLQTVQAEAPVRTRLIYQNTMFEIAGLLIERLSGQRWHHFLAERLWQPIGMLETYGTREQIGADESYVTPHLYLDNKLSVPAWDFSAGLPFTT